VLYKSPHPRFSKGVDYLPFQAFRLFQRTIRQLLLAFIVLQIVPQEAPAVFILMAIDAEVFPVGAVGGIIAGVPVLVVHGQELPIPVAELPAALGANQAVNLQGAFPVIPVWIFHGPTFAPPPGGMAIQYCSASTFP
jgi:hypothetical protein